MHKVTVRDFMTKKLVKFSPETGIYYAINELVKHGISGAPVVDENNHCIGILSEKDCLRVLANGVFHGEAAGSVKDYMTDVVKTIESDIDIFSVADFFLKNHYRRLLVVEMGVLVGQISRRDVLRAVCQISQTN